MLNCLSRLRFCVTLWTVACQGPLAMWFSRGEYWSGLPCPPPGALPYPRKEPVSLMSPALVGRFYTTSAAWEAPDQVNFNKKRRVVRKWVKMPDGWGELNFGGQMYRSYSIQYSRKAPSSEVLGLDPSCTSSSVVTWVSKLTSVGLKLFIYKRRVSDCYNFKWPQSHRNLYSTLWESIATRSKGSQVHEDSRTQYPGKMMIRFCFLCPLTKSLPWCSSMWQPLFIRQVEDSHDITVKYYPSTYTFQYGCLKNLLWNISARDIV